MEQLLYELSAEMRYISHTFDPHRSKQTTMLSRHNLTSVSTKLKSFLTALNAEDSLLKTAFLNLHSTELNRIAFTLKSIKNNSLLPLAQQFYNELQIGAHIPTGVTLIFNEFIKGITFFEDEQSADTPIYHRLVSCGPGDDSFRNAYLQCNSSMSPVEVQKVSNRINTCYIERLIYDVLWKDQSLYFPTSVTDSGNKQNKGHLDRIEVTHNDYKTCFPDTHIEAHIIYMHMWPSELTLVKKVRDTIVSVVTYTKTVAFSITGAKYYENIVESHMTDSNDMKYLKVSTFANRGSWRKL
jgi:hypothetical protein